MTKNHSNLFYCFWSQHKLTIPFILAKPSPSHYTHLVSTSHRNQIESWLADFLYQSVLYDTSSSSDVSTAFVPSASWK